MRHVRRLHEIYSIPDSFPMRGPVQFLASKRIVAHEEFKNFGKLNSEKSTFLSRYHLLVQFFTSSILDLRLLCFKIHERFIVS